MEIYYFTLFILMIFSFFEFRLQGNKKLARLRKFYWFPLALIILQIGFRWDMATDWDSYLYVFKNFSSDYTVDGMEPGFLFLNLIFKKLIDSYQFFILVQALVLYLFVFKLFRQLTPYPIFAVLWFYTINLGLVGSSRQLLAVSIVALALVFYLKNKKWYYYAFFIVLAMQFHTTAFIAIFYLLFDRKIPTKVLYLLILVSLLIGLSPLSTMLTSYAAYFGETAAEKADYYTEEIGSYSATAILKRLVIIIPLLYFRNKKVYQFKNFNFVINGYIFGVCLYFVFGQSFGILATRGAFYFNLMEPVIITFYLLLFKEVLLKHVYVLAITIFSFVLLRQSIVLYPELFAPYKTQYFKTDLIKY